jgi:hypothetical protein
VGLEPALSWVKLGSMHWDDVQLLKMIDDLDGDERRFCRPKIGD